MHVFKRLSVAGSVKLGLAVRQQPRIKIRMRDFRFFQSKRSEFNAASNDRDIVKNAYNGKRTAFSDLCHRAKLSESRNIWIC